ncbi:MAG: hypothetical protein ACLQJR_28365 [Stellaceae bacterium]
MNTVQTNVRVAESDRQLIVQVAQKLRSDADFRERLAALLADQPGILLDERIKKLEQQVSWLLSGAIVVPRATTRPAPPAPALPKMAPPKAPPSVGPRRLSADHD